ncbi:hypothetical protein OPT61_g9801 [Boeremia exigua]|uniref:Uncharacterized protein n=1 Tax=Boeremia exigua TaxID=749465 RepID=A0ACC2HSX1_9PLEO|nr:hypothetical protein OPT61_g9801 [Boeremia exigua]
MVGKSRRGAWPATSLVLMVNASGEASSAKRVTVTGIVIGGATQGRRNILETTNLSIRVLLPPVILLDDKLVVGMVEQKGETSCHHPNNDRDAAFGVHVSNPDFVADGMLGYLCMFGKELKPHITPATLSSM